MSNYSNLYAQKMFAEHPLSLWALDESVHFLSAIIDTDNDLSNWSRTGVDAGSFSMADPDISPYYKLGTDVNRINQSGFSGTSSFVLTSDSTFSSNGDDETFTVGFYYFKKTPFVTSIEIGYKVGATTTYADPISTADFYEWSFASATFADDPITDANIVIKFNVVVPSGTGIVDILINGITGGIWSEEHNMDYSGAVPESIPAYIEDITGNTLGIKAQKYASDEGYGYYVIGTDGKLSARNASMPMVYGAYNSTILRPGTNNEPSIILPGNGFLLDSEKFKSRTFEGWFRIDVDTTELRKIVGPISTTDGLYVTGPFMVLKIGKNYKSYFVGEWNRPMLIHISTSASSAQVMVNGDVVISMSVNMSLETLADVTIDEVGPVNDWIGIYAYDDVPVVEVDCIAIYPYEIDTIMAQRKFVLGEAVKFPESLVTAYEGQSVVPDYAFAEYSYDQNYGSNQKSDWNQGTSYNFDLKTGPLKSPLYTLPTIRTNDAIPETEYYDDLAKYINEINGDYVTNPYFRMNPKSSGTKYANGAHIFFENLDIINDVKIIYVVGQSEEYDTAPQTIFKIYNQQNGDYLQASIVSVTANQNRIEYEFSYGSSVEILATSGAIVNSGKFVAGLHLDKLQVYDNVSNFLANRSQLKVYVGSQENYSETFSGNIFKVGFCEEYNASLIEDEFGSYGAFYQNEATPANMINHKPSYGLNAFIPFNLLEVDLESKYVVPEISTSSYWKEDIPLSYFAKKITNDDGTFDDAIDFIQVNFDYPHPIAYTEGGMHYTNNSLVRTYITFQKNLGTVSNLDSAINSYGTPDDYFIDVQGDWEISKYEVVDGTVIGVPRIFGLDISDISIVVHVVANAPQSINYPINVRSLSLSSQAMNLASETPLKIGTRFGVDLIPFGTNSNGTSPMVTTKNSDPYYYLSDHSGLKIAGPLDEGRGYYFNINDGESDLFNIGGIQTTLKIDGDILDSGEVKLFSISKDLENNDLRFYLEAANFRNTRGRIVARLFDGTDETEYTDLEYFINGSFANDPVITSEEWVTLGINFTSLYSDENLTVPTIVNFNDTPGRFNFYASMLINNFSYFQLKKTQEEQKQIISRRWAEVEYTAGATPTLNTWQDWKDETPPSPYKWSDLIQTTAESKISGLDAQELYQSFIGSNNIVFETETSQIKPNKFRYDVHSNFVTTSIVLSAL